MLAARYLIMDRSSKILDASQLPEFPLRFVQSRSVALAAATSPTYKLRSTGVNGRNEASDAVLVAAGTADKSGYF